jgi:hypothetical protein
MGKKFNKEPSWIGCIESDSRSLSFEEHDDPEWYKDLDKSAGITILSVSISGPNEAG